MKRAFIWGVILFLLLDVPTLSAQGRGFVSICRRTSGQINVDGVLDEDDWRKAQYAGEFLTFDNKVAPKEFHTNAKLLWDEKHLYVAFFCRDPDVWATIPNKRGDMCLPDECSYNINSNGVCEKIVPKDDHLYWEEIVEVLIDADNDKFTYVEIEVNPFGAIYDAEILHDGKQTIITNDLDWTCEGIKVAVKIDGTVYNRSDEDKGWTVEMAIPFESLPDIKRIPPKQGEFGMALIRYERYKGEFYHLNLAPCYVKGGPHIPERFGQIIFNDAKDAKAEE